MAELQAEIELTVELRKFINIDLFVQGYKKKRILFLLFIFYRIFSSYYQIRTGIKFAPRIQSATKIEIKSELPSVIGKIQLMKKLFESIRFR
jgi:hypothetical protein